MLDIGIPPDMQQSLDSIDSDFLASCCDRVCVCVCVCACVCASRPCGWGTARVELICSSCHSRMLGYPHAFPNLQVPRQLLTPCVPQQWPRSWYSPKNLVSGCGHRPGQTTGRASHSSSGCCPYPHPHHPTLLVSPLPSCAPRLLSLNALSRTARPTFLPLIACA